MTNAQLKRRADRLVDEVERGDHGPGIFDDLRAIRDEMALRVDRPEDGTSGVREPRRPLPGGSSAAAAVDEEL